MRIFASVPRAASSSDELEVVAQVGAAIDAVAARRRAAAPKISPKMSPNASAKPPKPSGAARAGRAEPADGSTPAWPNWSYAARFFGVGQDLVGFLGFLEFVLGALVVRIAVRMVLHRELAIRLLDVVFGCVAIDAEHRVVVALRHESTASAPDHRHSRRYRRLTQARRTGALDTKRPR